MQCLKLNPAFEASLKSTAVKHKQLVTHRAESWRGQGLYDILALVEFLPTFLSFFLKNTTFCPLCYVLSFICLNGFNLSACF